MPRLIPKQKDYPVLDPNNLPEGYYLDKMGCIRDNEYHRLQKGGAGLNIKGKGKQSTLIKKLKKKFKNDEIIVEELHKMITYDWDKDLYINAKGESKRAQFPRVKEQDKLAAIKLVLAYVYGRPHTNITIDKTVDIKIEAKMHQVAELIHQNRDKLRIIQGGRDDEIIDVDPIDIITDEVENG